MGGIEIPTRCLFVFPTTDDDHAVIVISSAPEGQKGLAHEVGTVIPAPGLVGGKENRDMGTFNVVETKDGTVISNRLITAASAQEAAEIATTSHHAEGWNLYKLYADGETVRFETVLHLADEEVDAEEIRLCGLTTQKFWAAEIRTQWKVTPL